MRSAAASALIAVLLAGCVPATNQPVTASAGAEAVRLIGEADAGTTITLVRGQSGVRLELLGIPTAGYVWRVAQSDPGISLKATTSRPQNPAGRAAGMVGGSDWAIFTFDVAPGGPATVTLVYGRPWELEAGQMPAKTLRYTVVRP